MSATTKQKKQKLTFKGYWESLKEEPQKLIDELVEATGKSERTIKYYISGEILPDKLTREKIAEITRRPEKELFNLPKK
jgi:hypothetical protein